MADRQLDEEEAIFHVAREIPNLEAHCTVSTGRCTGDAHLHNRRSLLYTVCARCWTRQFSNRTSTLRQQQNSHHHEETLASRSVITSYWRRSARADAVWFTWPSRNGRCVAGWR